MTTKSPNLEVVSEAGKERRRVLRLNLTHEQFRLTENGKIFSVVDLSKGGMALRILDGNDLFLFPVGRAIQGTLNLRREKHPIKARVRHVGPDLVGCEFDELDQPTQKALEQFFDPVALGKELAPIPSDANVLWYHGASGTDLLLWRSRDNQFYRLTLFLMGSYVQWENSDGVSTGHMANTYEQSEVHGVMRFETMLLSPDSRPDKQKLEIAKTLILSSNLPQEIKKWCERQLSHQ